MEARPSDPSEHEPRPRPTGPPPLSLSSSELGLLLEGSGDRLRAPLSELLDKLERLASSELSPSGRDAADEALDGARTLLAEVDRWLSECGLRPVKEEEPGAGRPGGALHSERFAVRGCCASVEHEGEPGARGRVLLVDPDAVTQRVTLGFLMGDRYEVRAAETSTEALELLADEHFDAVLLDVSVSGLPLQEFVDELRDLAGGQLGPIVALSSEACPEAREACTAEGLDAFLSKPLRRGALHELLRVWLGG